MIIENNRKRTDLVPYKKLPDEWAARGKCLLCGVTSLKVVHLQEGADFVVCQKCELSFEAEQNNEYIRIKNVPEELGFLEDDLKFNWVRPKVLREVIANRDQLRQEKVQNTRVSLTDDEVWSRMLGLYRLGNPPKLIQYTMIQAGATREQTEAGARRLEQIARQDQEHQGRKLWIVSLAGVLLLGVLIASGWLFTTSQISAQLEQGSHGAAQATPQISLEALNNLPDAIKPAFLKGPPPSVDHTAAGPARCPRQSGEAATLFGGDEKNWQAASQPGAWQMITTGQPVTVNIPKAMYAAYIDNKTFVLKEGDGPSTISNVNFVIVSCQ
jgi:hypothetical protein